MQNKHANAAGMGAPVRLRPVLDSFSGSNTPPLTQEKATGALHGTTAAIENQHPDFAGIAQALQIQNIMAGLPALVDRFDCGIEHDLAHMTVNELAGLYAHLTAIKGAQA
jgi:hypothetical protein